MNVPEDKHELVRSRQRPYGLSQQIPQLAFIELALWVGAFGRPSASFRQSNHVTSGAQTSECLMERNPRQPRQELRPSGESMQLTESAEKRLLDDILRIRLILDHCPDRPIQSISVAIYEQLKERPLSAADPLDDFPVGDRSGFWRRHS